MKNREFFTATGQPDEEMDRIAKRKGAHDNKIARETVKVPELCKIIERVDFGLLRKILMEIAGRSGINTANLNFIGPKRVVSEYVSEDGIRTAASYNMPKNTISIYDYGNRSLINNLGLKSDLVILVTLIHEEIHATARNECHGLREFMARGNKKGKGMVMQKSGLIRVAMKYDGEQELKSSIYLRFLDDGVTEKLAREVLAEYLRRDTSFVSKQEAEKFNERYCNEIFPGKYDLPVHFVNGMVSVISRETGMDKDFVWRALVRSKYEGEGFEDKELVVFMDEMFFPGFLEKLKKADVLEASEQTELLNLMEQRLDRTEPARGKTGISKVARWFGELIKRLHMEE